MGIFLGKALSPSRGGDIFVGRDDPARHLPCVQGQIRFAHENICGVDGRMISAPTNIGKTGVPCMPPQAV